VSHSSFLRGVCGAVVLLVLVGCASRQNPGMSEPTRSVAPGLVTRQVTWRGWQAIQQSNGLITLRHVPAIGGRTMSMEINGHDCILVFPEQQGRSYPAGSRKRSVHFGGHYACIGPERIWNVHEQAFNPHAGPYEAEVTRSGDEEHVVTLTSQPGTWRGATYQIARRITVRKGTTHVVVDERITNRGEQPLEFYLWDFTQIDAVDRTRSPSSLRNVCVYVPVPEEAGRKQYHVFTELNEHVRQQFDRSCGAGILAIRYLGWQCKIASHPARWWLACVDRDTGWTYVKTFERQPGARYVDDNGPVEVYTSPYDRTKPEAFIELELLTGLKRYRPGGCLEQREHWYLTTCFGPVVGLADGGVVAEGLRARRIHTKPSTNQGDEPQRIELAGRYGVFYLGHARVALLDATGRVVARGPQIPIDPRQEFVLRCVVPVPIGVARAVLVVFDHTGRRVGVLDEVRLG